MKTAWLVLIVSLLSVGELTTAGKVYAAEKPTKQQLQISAQEAASRVISRFGGKVLKVSSTRNGYRVKVIQSDGRIISVFVDGKTGKIHGG